MGGFTDKFKHWWQTADRNQKTVTIGGSAVLICLLFATFMFATRPKYETLYSNLTEQEQAAVVTDLQGMGFDAQYSKAGVVEVPASEKAAARIKLAAANKLPKSQGQWGLGALNTMPFGVTPNVEQVRLKAIAEGEISTTIEQMDGVDSARVHLTLPEKTAFTEEQKPVTASVSLVTNSSASIGPAQGRAIATLVKNAVDGLELKDVVVINQHSQFLWNGEDEKDGGVSGAEKKTDLDDEVSKRRQRELQALLDQAFGAGAAIVTVHADVDLDASKTVTDEHKPTGASVVQSNKEIVSGTPAKPAKGVGGLNGQAPQSTDLGSASSTGNYNGTTNSKQYFDSEVQNETKKATGGIRGMAINVVVDSTRIQDKGPVQTLLEGDLGDRIQLDASGNPKPNQAFSVTVTSVPFDKTAAKQEATEATAAASSQRIQQIISMLPIGALLLVAAMVVKQIAKFAKMQTSNTMLAMTPEGAMLPVNQGPNSSDPAITHGELSNLLAEIEESPGRRAFEDPSIEVEDIKNKVHVPLEQLRKMAHERPALVAQLIKSMLLEEKR